jgi:hypothetical protein
VVVAALTGYPLSIGPNVWWKSRKDVDVLLIHYIQPSGVVSFDRAEAAREMQRALRYPLGLGRFYSPIEWIAQNSPRPVYDAIQWYMYLWGRRKPAGWAF